MCLRMSANVLLMPASRVRCKCLVVACFLAYWQLQVPSAFINDTSDMTASNAFWRSTLVCVAGDHKINKHPVNDTFYIVVDNRIGKWERYCQMVSILVAQRGLQSIF